MMISIWQSSYDIHVENCRMQGTNQLVCSIPNFFAYRSKSFARLTEYSIPVYSLSSVDIRGSWTFVDNSEYRQVLKQRTLDGFVMTVYDAKEI
jgi:hypothetical protein